MSSRATSKESSRSILSKEATLSRALAFPIVIVPDEDLFERSEPENDEMLPLLLLFMLCENNVGPKAICQLIREKLAYN